MRLPWRINRARHLESKAIQKQVVNKIGLADTAPAIYSHKLSLARVIILGKLFDFLFSSYNLIHTL